MAKREAHRSSFRGWGRVRRGARRIDLEDEGGALFIYDEAHARAIARDLPKHLGNVADPAHARLAKAGRLVTIRLEGDGMAAAELLVGPPLSAQERAALPFGEPQEAFLHVPSGRLRVETPSTIPIPWASGGASRGFVCAVPPGRYRLTLHRLDRRKLSRSIGKGKHYDGPRQLITLTALVRGGRRPPVPPVVPWFRPDPAPGTWVIEEGVFRGQARFGSYRGSFRVNLDARAAASLGLEDGAGLSLHVPALDFRAEAVFTNACPVLAGLPAGATRGLAPEFAVAFWESRRPEERRALSLCRIRTRRLVEQRYWDRWLGAEVRVGPAPKLARALQERLGVADGPVPARRER